MNRSNLERRIEALENQRDKPVDINAMTNEQLMRLAGFPDGYDLSALTDEELYKLAGVPL